MNFRLTRTLKIVGLTFLMAGAVVAAPQAGEAAPARRAQYRSGQWYTIRGQRLQHRNGYWYNSSGQRRWDLDRDGIPNRKDRDRDGDGIRNQRDRRPNHRSPGSRDLDRDGIRNRKDQDRDGDGIRNRRDRLPNVRKTTARKPVRTRTFRKR